MYATFNYCTELKMTLEQAKSASHSVDCESDVVELMKVPSIKRQLAKLDEEAVRRELKEYGAWDETELSDHDENLKRLVWIAAGDIVESSKR